MKVFSVSSLLMLHGTMRIFEDFKPAPEPGWLDRLLMGKKG